MTTIVLVTIGVLLAAASAMFVVFYGGSAFNSGTTMARASNLHNAGMNVVAANAVYGSVNGRPATSLPQLLEGRGFLKRPEIPADDGTISDEWMPMGTGTAFVIRNVPTALCAEINEERRGNRQIPTAPSGQFGCVAVGDDHVYYAMVGGSSAGPDGGPGGPVVTPPAGNTIEGDLHPANVPGQ